MRLGVAMLKVTSGVGDSVSEVKDDMVMARMPPSGPGWRDVHTTTECGRSRIIERSCSGRGSDVFGWDVGGFLGEGCHACGTEDVCSLWDIGSGHVSDLRR